MSLYYAIPDAFSNIDSSNSSTVYMDLVYFSTIAVTTIGFGDITPKSYHTKLVLALFAVANQFYSVVLIGILISKFSANLNN